MKRKSCSDVTFVTIDFLKRVTWIHMLHLFIQKKSHSNMKSMTTHVFERVTWKNMFWWSMKRKSHSVVTFVTTDVVKRVPWKNMWQQFMKKSEMFDYTFAQRGKMMEHVHEKKNLFKCEICVKNIKCAICAKIFFLKHYLKVHVTSIHGNNKQS